jgi:uncharacterized Zn-finger protein
VEKCTNFRTSCVKNDIRLRELLQEGKDRQKITEKVNSDFLEIVRGIKRPDENSLIIEIDPLREYESSDEEEPGVENGQPDMIMEKSMLDLQMSNNKDSLEFFGQTIPQPYENRFHLCKYCDTAFVTQDEAAMHEEQDHDPHLPYACHLCFYKNSDRNSVIAHLKIVHQQNRPFICVLCQKGFPRRADLKKHTQVHLGIRPFTCHLCGKSFSRNANLTKHFRIHQNIKPHTCPTCGMAFGTRMEVKTHQVVHLDRPFRCLRCDQSFVDQARLEKHEFMDHHSPQSGPVIQLNPVVQPVTVIQPPSPPQMHQDQQDIDDFSENLVIAFDSSFPEIDPKLLNAAANADGQKNSGFSIPEHMYMVPTITDDQPQPEGAILLHSLQPAGAASVGAGSSRKFLCQQCPRRFASNTALQLHVKMHSGPKNYVCAICTKAFYRQRELDRHSSIHLVDNEKPFECKFCFKRFGRKDKLMRHEKIHTADKKYDCTECTATFTRKDALHVHFKSHMQNGMVVEGPELGDVDFLNNSTVSLSDDSFAIFAGADGPGVVEGTPEGEVSKTGKLSEDGYNSFDANSLMSNVSLIGNIF